MVNKVLKTKKKKIDPKTNQKQTKMDQKRTEHEKVDKIDQKWTKWSKNEKFVRNGPKLLKTEKPSYVCHLAVSL